MMFAESVLRRAAEREKNIKRGKMESHWKKLLILLGFEEKTLILVAKVFKTFNMFVLPRGTSINKRK